MVLLTFVDASTALGPARRRTTWRVTTPRLSHVRRGVVMVGSMKRPFASYRRSEAPQSTSVGSTGVAYTHRPQPSTMFIPARTSPRSVRLPAHSRKVWSAATRGLNLSCNSFFVTSMLSSTDVWQGCSTSLNNGSHTGFHPLCSPPWSPRSLFLFFSGDDSSSVRLLDVPDRLFPEPSLALVAQVSFPLRGCPLHPLLHAADFGGALVDVHGSVLDVRQRLLF